ncbi:MAG: hypothetical protein AAF570_14485 [Bacteroidota bacterium]
MDIQAEKYLLIEKLKLVTDPSLIQAVKKLIENGLQNGTIDASISLYNAELEAAEGEFEDGDNIPHEDVLREAESW